MAVFSGANGQIQFVTRTSGVWSTPANIPSALTAGGLAMALLPMANGAAFLVFEGTDFNFYWTQYSSGAWAAVAPFSTPNIGNPSGSDGPIGMALDALGNLWVTDQTNNRVLEYPWTGTAAIGTTLTLPYTTPVIVPASLNGPTGVVVDGKGHLYVADTGNARIEEISYQSFNFGSEAIKSTSAAQTLNFSIASGTTVGSIGVMTAGSPNPAGGPNLDFVNACGSGSCTQTTYSTATNCVVNLTFAPTAAGMRPGAVVFFSGAGNTGTILASVPVYGVGSGPQVVFGPTAITRINPIVNGAGLGAPTGLAFDGAGDLFIVDANADRLVEVPANGGAATAIALPVNPSWGTFNTYYPGQALAIDGAGDFFIAQYYPDTVLELPAGGGTPVYINPTVNGASLLGPSGLAIDGAGDLFISDDGNHRLVEVPAGGGAPIAIAPSYRGLKLDVPEGLAFDTAGDLFIADGGSGLIFEVPAGDGPTSLVNVSVGETSLYQPFGITVDAAGDLYIYDAVYGFLEVPPGGGAATTWQRFYGGGVNSYVGMALDGTGNLFVTNTQIAEKFQRSQPTLVNFPTLTAVGTTDTADGTQMIPVENIGNQPLDFTALSYPADFSAASDGNACSGSTSLGNGQECDLPIQFTPQSSGSPLSESVLLTDNTLNVAPTTQTIAVSGAASAPFTVTVGTSPAGAGFYVDNSGYFTAQTLIWATGSTHTLDALANSYSADGGTEYAFSNWNPGTTSPIDSVTQSAGVSSYTANYVISAYLLSAAPNNSAWGSVTPAAAGYYAAGAPTPITATASAGYFFTGWTGSADIASASSVSTTITMNGPETVTATFAPIPNLVVNTTIDDAGLATKCTAQTTPSTNLIDSACSLRDALLNAANTGAGNISFSSTVFAAGNTAAANTMTLSNGTLSIPSYTSIAGATSGSGSGLTNLVTVNGNGASTVFAVNSGVTGATISGLTVTNGNSSSGGGINNSGELTVSSSTISGNSTSGSGGGINNSGTLTLRSSTLSGNSAQGMYGGGSGGGVYSTGTLTVSNCTFYDNSATGEASGVGGGIDNNGGTMTVGSSTLYSNSSDGGGGGGLHFGGGSAILAYNIVSGNSSPSGTDVSGSFTNDGGNQIGVSGINLATLANYGGPTQTMLPLPGSPAICGAQLGDGTLVPNLLHRPARRSVGRCLRDRNHRRRRCTGQLCA